MCGIFGFSIKNNSSIDKSNLKNDIALLYKLSERRGVEAAGFAIQTLNTINVYKKAVPAYKMTQFKEYNDFIDYSLESAVDNERLNFIAHSRLVTNGIQADNENNQPAYSNNLACVHNGIITNVNKLKNNYKNLSITSELDTEIFIKLVNHYYSTGLSIADSISKVFNEIEGYANIGLLDNKHQLVLATNNGSLYYIENNFNIVFASEHYILREFLKKSELYIFSDANIKHLKTNNGVLVNNNEIHSFTINNIPEIAQSSNAKEEKYCINNYDDIVISKRNNLKRCTKCILPETMPFIVFDGNGECNYCKAYKPKKLLGKEKLKDKLKSVIAEPDKSQLIFAFSGGRDSCYALHYMVKELEIKPIAYSYDWGMITDLGRRNQARMLGKLGIEHVIVSADLRKKRDNIRKNVEAWLKKPDLGMIPLIIAGDKQMFYYAQQVQKNYDAKAFMFSTNYLEKTDFKTGFANVNTLDLAGLSMALTNKNKYAMIMHYFKNFVTNPAYINSSLIDTFDAFTKYYSNDANERIEFYDYINWDEHTVNNTLLNEYNWETSPDTPTTWRIGDGTAAFYNYIYYTVAGFTENDTFRSNQIREGVLSRDKALELISNENKPRWKTIKEYCGLIQVDFVKAIEIIDNIPKLYI